MIDQQKLITQIEALLFTAGEPLKISTVAGSVGAGKVDAENALYELQEKLKERGSGMELVLTDTTAGLAAVYSASEVVEAYTNKVFERDIGQAGLEVLAIVLYMGPRTRSAIDYIRGVNSSSTIRNLLTRSLIERAKNPNDSREYMYRPTVELLSHVGVSKGADLPEYDIVRKQLAGFEIRNNDKDTEQSN